MKKSSIFTGSMVAVLAILLALPLFSARLGGKDLVKNGEGDRSMRVLGTVYTAELMVPQELKGATSTAIIDANEPMQIKITIKSRMITKDRFVSAVSDGLDNAASAGYPTTAKQAYIDLFENVDVSPGDVFLQSYVPGQGLTIQHNNKTLGTIQGLQFKKAFFAIFIGPKPVQASLKNGLLGN